MPRHPSTPDCAVKGCERAAHRLGLCRAHAPLVPRQVSVQLALDCLRAQRRLKLAAHREAARIANAAVRAERRSVADR